MSIFLVPEFYDNSITIEWDPESQTIKEIIEKCGGLSTSSLIRCKKITTLEEVYSSN